MGYTKDMDLMRNLDVLTEKTVELNSSYLKIKTLNFRSNKIEPFGYPSHPDIIEFSSKCDGYFGDSDELNTQFDYPIFLPLGEVKHRNVIVLLHGLNERSWMKYLPWAKQLANSTQSAVVLFPISYHINRAPKQWSDPRAMIDLLKNDATLGKSSAASFANVALSERLRIEPLRFFHSGYQSADDIVRLLEIVGRGTHPYISAGAKVNFFAYSIGAMLAQSLFIANPSNLLSDSRLFMFSGGAFFHSMNGVSRLIMDQQAFQRVYSYYNEEFEQEASRQTRLGLFMRENLLAMAFRSMINPDRLRDFRNDMLAKMKNQIYAISLLKDSVIPATGVSAFFRQMGSKNIEMVDFAYPYSHEQPFPINGRQALSAAVDGGFNHVFKRAASFLG